LKRQVQVIKEKPVKSATSTGRLFCLGALCLLLLAPPAGARADEAALARQILETTGVTGGLIMHLDCGDGRLTAALCPADCFVVQGLDTEASDVRAAREHVGKLGLYGPVSVEPFDGRRLPYAENLVNLIVGEDLGEVPAEEAIRVLAPGGVLCVGADGQWKKTVKPQPKNTDEWTHFLYDASGNPVAHDDVVGPPRRAQWIAGPPYTRCHEYIPSIYAVVSSAGRIFYIEDEGPIASVRQPSKWRLVARDAYNGTLLWQEPIDTWYPHIVNWGRTPRQLERKLVAIGDRVYVTLGLFSPLVMVDAASGQIRKTYDGTVGAEEIVWHKGTLLLAVRKVTDDRVAELAEWNRLMRQDDSPVYDRDKAVPLVNRLGQTENKAEVSVLALDAESGRILWKKDGPDADGLKSNTLSALGDRAFYQNGKDVVCLDLATGRELWTASAPPLFVLSDRSVLCADGRSVVALSPETGKPQWTRPTGLIDVRDVFVAAGSVWVGGFGETPPGKRSGAWGPYFVNQFDPATGEMGMQIEPENPSHHHRCYQNKATDRYILGGRRGTEFIDLATGDVQWNSFARGVCRYGVMPANGLLYTPPHACGCYVEVKLSGFRALAPAEKAESGEQKADQSPQLHRGPAYSDPSSLISHPSSLSSWPAYRHDAERSGATGSSVPAELGGRWQADVGGVLTAPTVADGKVFVAAADAHQVTAVNADSGLPAWRFTAGGRVDSPPTIFEGKVLFGCRDGFVYCLRADDGALVWRLGDDRQRQIMVDGQLESTSPIHGSILVDGDAAYFTRGESSYLDGGISLCRFEPASGKVLSATQIYSPDPETGKQPPQSAPSVMPGARSDILSADAENVYLQDAVYDKQCRPRDGASPHLFALTGFLDGSGTHRSFWIYGEQCSISTGCSGRDKNIIAGRLMVFDRSTVYGYGRASVHWSNQLQDGPYRLFASPRGEGEPQWQKPVPIAVRAMVLAGDVLFIAGPPADKTGWMGSFDVAGPPMLMAVSASDGSVLAECPLDAPPIFDGMAAAGGRLYIALENGRLACMDGK
jgi:outer membrane protein assembly factor BamB